MGRVFAAGYYLALTIFLVIYLRQLDFGALKNWVPEVGSLALASAIGMVYRIWGVFSWIEMLRLLGARITSPPGELAYVYAKAWMGRYLPGKVSWILGKIWFGARLGISSERLAIGAVVESTQQIAVTLFLALVLLSLDSRSHVFFVSQRGVLAVSGLALMILVSPALFNYFLRLARRLPRYTKPNVDAVVTRSMLVYGVGLQSVAFGISGFSYVILAHAVDPSISLTHVVFLMGVFNLAGVIGILSVFAPSGLGVREGVLLLLLPLVMTPERALLLTVVARIWSTFIDLGFFALSYLLRSHQARL